jgi:hypothetical protein
MEHLETILADFRRILSRLSAAASRGVSLEIQDLATSVHRQASLRVAGQAYDRRTGRLNPIWDTERRSFPELLFSYIVLSFMLVPIRYLRQCQACNRFFFAPSGQRARYCTGRCQIRTSMARYRARKKHRRARPS